MQLEKNIEAISTGHIHQVEHAMTKSVGGALQRAAALIFSPTWWMYPVGIASMFFSNCMSMLF